MATTKIANWQYLSDYEQERQDVLEIVDRVFSSGRLMLGPEVENFEKHFAAFCGADHGVGVNSCTDALFLALKALGLGQGDEVLTVANTAVPTVAAIRAAGCRPVFVDVDADTFLMNPSKVEQLITSRIRCLLPVHLCGHPADMAPLQKIASDRGIPILEDCAQATGATYNGQKVGAIGTMGAFSFYPTKILGGFGDGGMVITSDDACAASLRRLRFYGMQDGYYAREEGYNSRLDEVQAALLDYRLQRVDEAVRRRREIARIYDQGLAGVGDLRLPVVREGCSHQYYLYTIRTNQRDRLQEFLGGQSIEARINYPVPIHLMDGYRFLGYQAGSLPVTEQLAGEILSLPMFPALGHGEALRVIDAIRAFFQR
ncbi:DegT/DnrJ/EryC1/StrS family aminotransferase [Pelotalea chapellei]|uniref:DegT/DnrJ/EryC1/StrS family aminotransferase n=1 Tax=Pelotalea chapellei TaxID=44671 RepID=A0ABS5UAL2_9BACT|nr:DegT/DnrJ/EryC1/StrS family aminotransferase [Pelotalea chapellei]MBT1072685.1 DegT/DnrJ/EryC1/StrS family aminotransferase [Pelotalea chapellei]